MREFFYILIGAIVTYILVKSMSGENNISDTWLTLKNLGDLQQTRNLVRTNEFREIVKTNEFKEFLKTLNDKQLMTVDNILLS